MYMYMYTMYIYIYIYISRYSALTPLTHLSSARLRSFFGEPQRARPDCTGLLIITIAQTTISNSNTTTNININNNNNDNSSSSSSSSSRKHRQCPNPVDGLERLWYKML